MRTKISWLLRITLYTSLLLLHPKLRLVVEASSRIPSFTRKQDEQEQQQPDPPDTTSITSFFWNVTSSIHDFFNYHSTQFHNDVIYHSTQFQKDVQYHTIQAQQDLLALADTIYNTLETTKNQIQVDLQQVNAAAARHLRKSQREVKKRLLRDVFKQRVGWERFRHSVRDHVGLVLGLWITFRGQVHNCLARTGCCGSSGFELAQLVWYMVDIHADNLMHYPWLHDVIATAAGMVAWKGIFPRAHPAVQESVPYVISPAILMPLWGIILEEWRSMDDKKTHAADKAPFLQVLGAVAATMAALALAGIPVPLAASSLSGAILVYDSVRAEIAGNWLHMIEVAIVVVRPILRLLRRLIAVLWRPALWIWRRLIRRIYNEFFSPETTQTFWMKFLSTIRTIWRTLVRPIDKCRQAIAELPVSQKVNEVALRVQKSLRPVSAPLGIAIWGVAVQMGYISGIGGVWKVFRVSLDPVSFVLGRVKAFFSPKSRVRKAAIHFVRSLPKLLGRRGR